jgi:hypothetical protein
MINKVFLVVLSVLVLFGAAGCNGEVKESTITTPVITTPQIPPTTTDPTPAKAKVISMDIPQELWDKWEAENAPVSDNSIEAKILQLYVTRGGPKENYGCVIPKSGGPYASSPSTIKPEMLVPPQRLVSAFSGRDITRVYASYIKANNAHEFLTAKSSKVTGYYIDYNNAAHNYLLEKYGMDFWGVLLHAAKLPGFTCYITLSMPGFDPETGLVLIEEGSAWGMTSGLGIIILYVYGNGVFTEIGRAPTWVS